MEDRKTIVISLAIATAMAGCGGTAMQNVATIDKIVSSTLGIPPVVVPAGLITSTAPTQDVIAVIDAPASPKLLAMVNESLPEMQGFLSELACSDGRNSDIIKRKYFLVKQNVFPRIPKAIMTSETDTCVALTYVGNFSAVADNRFTFEAHYKAPSSGERTQHRGEMQRKQSGDWLFLSFS